MVQHKEEAASAKARNMAIRPAVLASTPQGVDGAWWAQALVGRGSGDYMPIRRRLMFLEGELGLG